jgi:hypothetical protein
MADKLTVAAQNMIDNLKKKTGKSLAEWIVIARASGFEKHGQILKYLKTEQGLTHGYANLVTIKARETADSPKTDDDLINNQYNKKESLRPIYEAIMTAVSQFGDDLVVAPKKAYVSLRRNKQFGLIQPSTKTRVDVGINLRGVEGNGRLEASGSFNAMVSHRVRLSSSDDVNDELIGWLRQAYDAA